ncbi:hypothetical protein PIB30_109887, partial [Stylosanthes scabra]|nr:hypothetical protein [Stylosanthes scabra]
GRWWIWCGDGEEQSWFRRRCCVNDDLVGEKQRYVEGSVLSRAVPSGGLKEVVGVGVVKDGAVPLRVTPRREGAADP